jgi:predicted enzyme related to lactoylglutathione lyase
MTNHHGDFIWYELITPDPDGAKAFYDAVAGWDIEPQPSGEMDYRMIRVDGGNAGGVMRLTEDMAAHGARPTWLGYVGVDDVDAAAASVEKDGGAILMAAFDIPGVGRIAMVADPQGAPFYLMRGASEETSDVFSPDRVGRCAWHELATRNPKSALDFYTSRFGWAAGDTMPMGDMGDYQFIVQNGVSIGAIMAAAPGNPVLWRFYFRVADIGDAARGVEARGGKIVHGPLEVPGGDCIVIGIDPQGAEFALVGPKK